MLKHNAVNYKRAQPGGGGWFRRGIGRWVAHEEKRLCRDIITDIFGLYAVQLGGERATLHPSPTQHHLLINGANTDLRADGYALPFSSDALDLLIMVHTLESSDAPHAVLREAVRVLRPEGRLIIIGFNRWSLLSLSRAAPWRKNWLSVARINDWLTLLEMQPLTGDYAVFLPPWRWALQRRWRLRWLELAGRRWWPLAGGIFILHTVKRRQAVRLLLANTFNNKQVKKQPALAAVGADCAPPPKN